MKLKYLFCLMAICVATVFASCSTPMEKGTPITAAEIESIMQDPANVGKRYTLEGYLCTPNSMYEAHGEPVAMGLHTEAGGEGEIICTLMLKHDVRNNSFYLLNDNYSDEDIMFVDNEGGKHKYDQKAQYSFTVSNGESGIELTDVRIDVVQ